MQYINDVLRHKFRAYDNCPRGTYYVDGRDGLPPSIFIFGEPDGVNAMDVLQKLITEKFGQASTADKGDTQMQAPYPTLILSGANDSDSDSEPPMSQHGGDSIIQELVRYIAYFTVTSLKRMYLFPM